MRIALALCVAIALGACSSSKNPALKPVELTDISPSLSARIAWSLAVGSARGALLQPAVVENAVYAAAADGTLLRVEPESGRVVWRVDAGKRLSAGVGSDGFTVAVGTSRGEVLAFDAEGKALWESTVPSDVTAAPLVGRGLVIVRSTDHRVTALSATDGKRQWVYQRNIPALTLKAPTQMSFAGDSVLVGFPGGRLVAIALSNGASRWEAVIAEPKGATEVERLTDVLGEIAVGEGQACAAAFQGRMTCVDAATGALRWTREWSAGGGVALDSANAYGVDERSHVAAFARSGGASVWRNEQLANRKLTTPRPLPSSVAVGDFDGFLHLLALTDGGFVARVRLDSSAITASPQSWADGLIVQTQGGTLARVVVAR